MVKHFVSWTLKTLWASSAGFYSTLCSPSGSPTPLTTPKTVFCSQCTPVRDILKKLKASKMWGVETDRVSRTSDGGKQEVN